MLGCKKLMCWTGYPTKSTPACSWLDIVPTAEHEPIQALGCSAGLVSVGEVGGETVLSDDVLDCADGVAAGVC